MIPSPPPTAKGLLVLLFTGALLWSFRGLADLSSPVTVFTSILGAFFYYFLFRLVIKAATLTTPLRRGIAIIGLASANILLWGLLAFALSEVPEFLD